MFAPQSIKKYKTPEEYVLAMREAQTEWLIIDNLTRVGRSAWKGEYFENPDSYGTISLSFTEDTMLQLDAIWNMQATMRLMTNLAPTDQKRLTRMSDSITLWGM